MTRTERPIPSRLFIPHLGTRCAICPPVLAALRAQLQPHDEIILVDNASPR
ncbi:MAG: hypothetical protein HC876_15980, partial [Chloroflexaceae bacterium]|nr:hypothetical protein [Chloroflexaceae bacterium]